MNKYIDADRLKAGIESIALCPQMSADYNDGRDDIKMMVLDLIDSLQQELPEANEVEKALSLQIQAYLTTASDELYAQGKPLYTKEHHEGIHECMKMWQKLHQYYFQTKQEQPDELSVPIWCLKNIENTLQIEYNIHCEKETGETCQDRNIKACLNSVTKILNGGELTGMERLEPLREQPEVDLDAEIAIYLNKNVLNRINNSDIIEDFTTMEAGELARHFYELGLKARKKD